MCLCLSLMTGAVFGVAVTHDFINYDDPAYVTKNHHVQGGLSMKGVVWAFTTTLEDHDHWHPVTMLSHMLDCQLFGLNPAGHHFTNILLHILNTILLFVLLHRMTKDLWPSALVAALFALHPLHVESVVWIAERKDVLSTFFMLATLWAYVSYVEESGKGKYLLALSLFAFSLMSKSIVVTLPFLLLLLDFWPLGRLSFISDMNRQGPSSPVPTRKILWEKAPFFLLSIIVSIVTLLARQDRLTDTSRLLYSFSERVIRTVDGYVFYIWKMFVPTNLSVAYLPDSPVFNWGSLLSLAFLIGVTFLCFKGIKKRPYLVVGWVWYLATLAPVSGIIQTGPTILADRYTYVPMVGLFIMLSWGLLELNTGRLRDMPVGIIAMFLFLAVCAALCFKQVGFWKNSVTLFSRTISVNPDNYIARLNLGLALYKAGSKDEALDHLYRAIQLTPQSQKARFGLGHVLCDMRRYKEAIDQLSEAIRISPTHGKAHMDLAICLSRTGRFEKAREHFTKAIELMPDNPEAYYNYGYALELENRNEEALDQMKEALDINPNHIFARGSLDTLTGIQLYEDGKIQEAAERLQEVVRRIPEQSQASHYLGLIALSRKEMDSAISHFSNAIKANSGYTEAHVNLGIALAGKEDFAKADEAFSEALKIEPYHVKARYNYAASLYLQHRDKEAVEELAKTLEIDPDYKEARDLLNTLQSTNIE